MAAPLLPIKAPECAELNEDTDPTAQILHEAISEAISGIWSAECLEKTEYKQQVPFTDLKQYIGLVPSTATYSQGCGEEHQSYGSSCQVGQVEKQQIINANEVDKEIIEFTEYVVHNALLGLLQDGSNIPDDVQ